MVWLYGPLILPVAALSEFNTCVDGQPFLQLSLVSSLGGLKRPTGHAEQELASTNIFSSGA